MSTDPVVHDSAAQPPAEPKPGVPPSSGASTASSTEAPARPRKRLLLILALALALAVILAGLIVVPRLGPQSDPAEVAVAYTWAGERRDYGAQWDLAGPELRDGRTKQQWIANWRRSDEVAQASPSKVTRVVSERVEVNGTRAVVLIRRELPDRTVFRELALAKNDGRWEVIAERLL
jgi:hypothetical protein